MKNANCIIGLFQGMFTREIQRQLKSKGIGSSLSWEMLWPEIKGIDLIKQAANVPIPVFYCTSTAPVIQYFDILSAPHKEIIWFENSGHRMDVEEPAKFQQQIIEKLLGERPN